MSPRTAKQTALIYQERQMKLRMHARHIRNLKRWCGGMLCIDVLLGGGYFVARQEVIELMQAFLG